MIKLPLNPYCDVFGSFPGLCIIFLFNVSPIAAARSRHSPFFECYCWQTDKANR